MLGELHAKIDEGQCDSLKEWQGSIAGLNLLSPLSMALHGVGGGSLLTTMQKNVIEETLGFSHLHGLCNAISDLCCVSADVYSHCNASIP